MCFSVFEKILGTAVLEIGHRLLFSCVEITIPPVPPTLINLIHGAGRRGAADTFSIHRSYLWGILIRSFSSRDKALLVLPFKMVLSHE